VIVGNGIANGLFMVVPNRTGQETRPDGTPGNSFYGSSFVSDPYGRILVQAPRDEPCVLVADLDLGQREDWLALFPFLSTRRPDTYGILTQPVDPASPFGSAGSR
jgi:N-carbamoylputrescine amidase